MIFNIFETLSQVKEIFHPSEHLNLVFFCVNTAALVGLNEPLVYLIHLLLDRTITLLSRGSIEKLHHVKEDAAMDRDDAQFGLNIVNFFNVDNCKRPVPQVQERLLLLLAAESTVIFFFLLNQVFNMTLAQFLASQFAAFGQRHIDQFGEHL